MQRDAALRQQSPVRSEESPSFVVAYAKIVDDKKDGVYLQDVFFSGVADDHATAETMARECVSTIRGGTILPRIVPLQSGESIIAAMARATKRFQDIESQMIASEEIMERTSQRKHR